MKRLADFRRITFAILAMFLTANLWGQTLIGDGTETSPYLIKNPTDWGTFAGWINAGTNADKYYRLDANNIVVSTIVGTSENKFAGTFDGNWNTLIFNNGSLGNPCSVEKCAPFGFVAAGTTIKNLTVEGTIISQKKFAAGLIGWIEGSGTYHITNCTSNITIDCSKIEQGASNKQYDCSTAGFIGQIESGTVYFTNCLFDGSILKGTQDKANRSAGFVSYNNGTTVYFANCSMAGTIELDKSGTFYRAKTAKHEYSNCYYITRPTDKDQEQFDDTNCHPAYNDETIGGLSNEIYKKYVINSTNYYIPGAEITGVATSYSYIGSPVEITPVVKYYGRTLTRGTEYIIKIDGTDVPTGDTPTLSAPGEYTFTIEGIGNYGGSTETDITVLNINSWSTLKDALLCDSGVFTLNGDIIADTTKETDTTLWVKTGNITLNLNGHTINRGLTRIVSGLIEGTPDKNGPGQVIRIKNGASLTINGPGTITGGFHKGAEGNIDGGGIYNMGNLTLNNVNVIGNKCIKQDGENFSGRGGGIYSGNTASLIITGGEITDNEAIGGGGGIYCYMSNPFNMTGVNIKSNVSEDKGGGIRLVVNNGKTANIINCNIIGNSATVNTESKGGGIYYEGSSNTTSILNLVNDTLQANTSFILGGAIYSHKGTITATNCVMNNNLSYDEDGFWANEDSYGGAVCLYAGSGDSYSTFIMDGGSITGDMSKTNGGGIYVYTHSIVQVKGNVIITNNHQVGFDEEDHYISSNNNIYLAGAASGDKIQVIGELGPDAVIGIANSEPGTYITVADGVSLEHIVEHITLDNNENRFIIDENGEVQVYVPYPWNEDYTWDGTIATITGGSYPPTTTNDVTINRAVKIQSGSVAYAKDITFGTYGSIIIEDGGQLINNNSIAVVAKKEIVAADVSEKSGWYIISSPVTDANITSATNLITPVADARYDLYRFNESASLPWENYKASHGDFTILQNGRGYLYRNEHNHIVDIDGNVNVSDVTYNLSCGGSGDFKGFNLIGNPYAENITLLNTTLVDNSGKQIVDGEGNPINLTGFYRLSKDDGSWGTEITSQSTAIAPLEGFLVQVDEARKVKFSKTARAAAKSNGDNIKFTVANDQYEDKTYALFEKGVGLEKIEHMNEDVPMVYISSNGADYAIATFGDEVKQFNLNFEAKTTGMYTLGIKTQGEFSYVHVIDKLAEKDIDLLNDGEYSFIGTPADEPDRFIVRLAYLPDYSDEGDDNFVYQNGDEILVSGKGELQVFDVMGRLVMQKKVNGVESVDGLRTGVYVMRIVGESVKTQKIVIR